MVLRAEKFFFQLLGAAILAAILFEKVNLFIKCVGLFYVNCPLTLLKLSKFLMESNLINKFDLTSQMNFNSALIRRYV